MSGMDAGTRHGRRSALFACLLLMAAGAAGTAGTAARGAEAEARYPTYCARVQQYLADTRRVARTVHHETLAAFARSKPEARPLVVHQYIHEDPDGRPEMISCKTKTADALLHAYGAVDEPAPAPVGQGDDANSARGAAEAGQGGEANPARGAAEAGQGDDANPARGALEAGQGGDATPARGAVEAGQGGDARVVGPPLPQSRRRCRDITLQTLWRVEARLAAQGASAAARAARQAQAAPNEPYLMGSSYLSEFPLVEFVSAADGARAETGTAHAADTENTALRINTRSLRVLWDDWRFRILPKSLRGVHYCHLVAPDYLQRLLLSQHPPANDREP